MHAAVCKATRARGPQRGNQHLVRADGFACTGHLPALPKFAPQSVRSMADTEGRIYTDLAQAYATHNSQKLGRVVEAHTQAFQSVSDKRGMGDASQGMWPQGSAHIFGACCQGNIHAQRHRPRS